MNNLQEITKVKPISFNNKSLKQKPISVLYNEIYPFSCKNIEEPTTIINTKHSYLMFGRPLIFRRVKIDYTRNIRKTIYRNKIVIKKYYPKRFGERLKCVPYNKNTAR